MKRVVAVSLAVLLVVLHPSLVLAQSTEVAAARTALTQYDVDGPQTLVTIRALGPVAGSTAPDALEARYLRAIAATDLHALALVTHDDALDRRVADAMGSGVESLDVVLRAELRAVAVGIYRGASTVEIAWLDAVGASARGERLTPGTSSRESAAFVLAARDAAGDPDRLAAMGTDEESSLGIDERARRGVAAIHAAHAAFERAMRGARDGDPWLVALAPALEAARVQLVAATLVPGALVPDSLSASVAEGEGVGDARPDVVLVLGAERVDIVCAPRIRVPDATGIDVIAPATHCPAIGTAREVSLPPAPAVVRPIDALVAALSDLGVNEGATIALAPTRDAAAQWIACARASLARAGLSATTLALRRPDGAFATMPFAWAPLEQTAFAMIVHVRPGGYAITRGHEHTVQLPRVRGASGLSFDREALASAVGARALQPVALDATSSVSALELVQAARIVAASGALALLRE